MECKEGKGRFFFGGGKEAAIEERRKEVSTFPPPQVTRTSRANQRDLRVTSPAQFCGHVNLEAEEKTCPHSFLG